MAEIEKANSLLKISLSKERCEMSEPKKHLGEDLDIPLSFKELRRLPREEATSEVPEELKQLGLSNRPEHRDVQFIQRSALAEQFTDDATTAIAPYHPPWVSASFAPKRARSPYPPTVLHRDERLTPLVIWQPDDRKIYNDTSYPWGCICKITTAFGRVGSGALIGPRHVLTASHVVEWSTNQAEKIEVHLTGNTSAATAFATNALTFTKISGSPTITTLDEDYAVLILNQRLGDRFGWMGIRTYNSSWDGLNVFNTIGYPTDVAGGLQPTFQLGKNLDEDEWDLGSGRAMTTSADAMRGQSGSPMFGFWPPTPTDPGVYAVAVMSAIGIIWASGEENWCSGGSDLTRLVKLARERHP